MTNPQTETSHEKQPTALTADATVGGVSVELQGVTLRAGSRSIRGR
jgi:hypothetical protein